MIDPLNKLMVLVDNVGVFTDHSNDAGDFLRDSFVATIDPTTDYMYIGFYKPFGTVFAELKTGNTNVDSLSVQYFDGTVWVDANPSDETKGFSRSGFVFWDKEEMEETIVNGETCYYVRLKPELISSPIEFNGINILFSDDSALIQEDHTVNHECLYAAGQNSHIVSHVASRNHIVQLLRNNGYVTSGGTKSPKNVTYFDVMDIFELRQAATYLTLSKIFFSMSDNQESIEWMKYKDYQEKFEEAFRLARLQLDSNDNGLSDDEPKTAVNKSFTWSR